MAEARVEGGRGGVPVVAAGLSAEAAGLAVLVQCAVEEAQLFARRARQLHASHALSVQAEGADGPERFLVLDLSGSLRVGQVSAGGALDEARRLVDDLPVLLSALGEGLVFLSQARIVLEETAGASVRVRREVDERLQGPFTSCPQGWTARRLRGWVKRLVLTVEGELDPELTAQRQDTATRRRSVGVRPEPDGMASLWALLPAQKMVAFSGGLDELARRERERDRQLGVVRTADQRRADVLASLPGLVLHALDSGSVPDGSAGPASAAGSPGCGPGGCTGRVTIEVQVPMASVLGYSQAPGHLVGYGPISAHQVRTLLPDAWLRQVLVDDLTGEVLYVDGQTLPPADRAAPGAPAGGPVAGGSGAGAGPPSGGSGPGDRTGRRGGRAERGGGGGRGVRDGIGGSAGRGGSGGTGARGRSAMRAPVGSGEPLPTIIWLGDRLGPDTPTDILPEQPPHLAEAGQGGHGTLADRDDDARPPQSTQDGPPGGATDCTRDGPAGGAHEPACCGDPTRGAQGVPIDPTRGPQREPTGGPQDRDATGHSSRLGAPGPNAGAPSAVDRARLARLVPVDVLVLPDVPEPRHDPSAALTRLLRRRDELCLGPGCSRIAGSCDLDHRDPWPHGPTSAENMGPNSRRCHRAKTFSWTVVRTSDGTTMWTGPTGSSYPVPALWQPPPRPRRRRPATTCAPAELGPLRPAGYDEHGYTLLSELVPVAGTTVPPIAAGRTGDTAGTAGTAGTAAPTRSTRLAGVDWTLTCGPATTEPLSEDDEPPPF